MIRQPVFRNLDRDQIAGPAITSVAGPAGGRVLNRRLRPLRCASMPSFVESAVLLGVVAALGYWLNAMRSLELARAAGQRACREAQVQLLDDTVEVIRVRLRRDPGGRLAFCRSYRFEFTDDGDRRHRGQVTIHGRYTLHLSLGS